jgi:hypothetical protein
MKNIFKAIAVLAGVAGLAACTKYAEYETAPFASLDFRSATVEESKTAATFTLPVHVYNYDGACSVTYTVDAGTAKEGVDYSLVDASGVLNFAEGTDTQNITISVTGQPGVYTGNLKFTVTLKSASNDVQIGAIKTCTVTVKDLDHPLSAILGEYDADGTCVFGREVVWPLTFSADEENDHKVWIKNIVGFVYYNDLDWDLSVYGIVSDDLKTITIPYLQKTGIEWDAAEDYMQLCSWAVVDDDIAEDETPGEFKLVWSERYGGFINDSRYGFDAALTGKMGNYYGLYYAANSVLFKQK